MRRMMMLSVMVVTAALLSGCAAGNMKTVWREPAGGSPALSKVVVFAAAKEEGVRRAAEDAFVLAFQGGATQAVQSYKALPAEMPADSVQVVNQLRSQGIDGALVLRYLGKDKDIMSTGGYSGYGYGGWYGTYGHGMAYDAPMVSTTTTYYISATLYTLEPPKLMWSGQGDTFNPSDVNQLIGEIARASVAEMRMQKVVK